ncbi:hypothetical protein Q2T40_16060 [Winogradskyella maritima]|jgi:hypothetical protein|uniref:Uncharacterized protein n=1 Tax=Winogradskyella maritima TaxID=1517766 RepID=A0ABV8AF85_9FLAO|nr:hypothetical protein [Winogradskyella maritima]
MDYTNDTSGIMDKVLYGLSGDTMLLSDKFRIASFLETTKHTLNKINKPSKTQA